MNGPGYILSTWDQAMTFRTGLDQLLHRRNEHDGDLQRVGQGADDSGERFVRQERARRSLLPAGASFANAFPTDLQFAALCAQMQPVNGNQAWHWKGEWWAFAGTMIYSHTNFPNRYACQYNDQNNDWRATITMVNASSMHPGGVNTLFMDGSVRFIKSSIGYQAWYAIATNADGEVVSSDQL